MASMALPPGLKQANSTLYPITCESIIPWWVTFVLPVSIFLLGLIIIGISNCKFICYACPTKKKKLASTMMKRKSRLLKSTLFMNEDLVDYNYLENDKKTSIPKSLSFILFFERIISKRMITGKFMNVCRIMSHLISWGIFISFTVNHTVIHYVHGDCYLDQMIIIQWIDFGLNIFCAFDFLCRGFASNDRIKFWIQLSTIVDICVIPNILLTTFLNVRRQGFSFVRVYYLREICDVFLLTFSVEKVDARFEIFKIVLYFFSLWMIGVGCFQMLEGIGDFWASTRLHQDLTIWNCVYFMLITYTSVGYGDINAYSLFGRILVIFYLIYGYTIFSTILPHLVYLLQFGKYNNSYKNRSGEKHMILSGNFNTSTLKAFLQAFKNKKSRFGFGNILIINSEKCDHKLSIYIKKFSTSITYLVGTLTRLKDMRRVDLKNAKMAVILSSPCSETSKNDDFENIMNAISLKAQTEKIRVIVQLRYFKNKVLLKLFSRWNRYGNDIVLCINELKLGLIGYNCLVPGIATLFSNLITSNKPKKSSILWRNDYEEGLKVQLYDVKFSENFQGLTCLEAALIIYRLWDVCLLAIKHLNKNPLKTISINPMIENFKIIPESMIGIVMARSQVDADRIPFYCRMCSNINPSVTCDCVVNLSTRNRIPLRQNRLYNHVQSEEIYSYQYEISKSFFDFEASETNSSVNVDESGSFYWNPEPKFDQICLSVEEAEDRNLSNHILVCLCGSGKEYMDLCNFMMPLRSRALSPDNLRRVVILGNKEYIEKEKWMNIKNFPMILIINSSPLQARNLVAAGLLSCYSCVILNTNEGYNKALDKDSIICYNLIKRLLKTQDFRTNVITEIRKDEIAYHFSSSNSQEYDSNLSVQHTEPFARGLIFPNNILYSCICSIYYNPGMLFVIKAMINGPNLEKVEKMFGSGVGLIPKNKHLENQQEPNVIFHIFSVTEQPFMSIPGLHSGNLKYETLFEWALVQKKILCIGLYRLNFRNRRYVYTHPCKSVEIYITDQIYCCLSSNYVNEGFAV